MDCVSEPGEPGRQVAAEPASDPRHQISFRDLSTIGTSPRASFAISPRQATTARP